MDPQTDDGFDVEVLATGVHQGIPVTEQDLDRMAANFTRLREFIKPPVRLGHATQIVTGETDTGQPALGWVAALRRDGKKLVARLTQVPAILRDAIAAGRYRRVSSEFLRAWERTPWEANLKTGATGPVFSGLAILGSSIPEVKNLRDLGALLHCELREAEATADAVTVDGPERPSFLALARLVAKFATNPNGDLSSVYTPPDPKDGHVHQVKTLDLMGNGQTDAAGEQAHQHDVTGFIVQQFGDGDGASTHPGELEAMQPPSFPRKDKDAGGRMAEDPKTPETDALAVKLAELEAQLADEKKARVEAETARKHAEEAQAAEIARLKLAEAQARDRAIRVEAEQFVQRYQAKDYYRLSPAQAPAALALYETLAKQDGVVVKFEEKDTSPLTLFKLLLEKAPDAKALFAELATTGEPTTVPDAEREHAEFNEGLKAIAKEHGLNLAVFSEKQRAFDLYVQAKKRKAA